MAFNTTLSPSHIVPSLFNKPDLSVTAIETSFVAFTVIEPVALTAPQPPINGII